MAEWEQTDAFLHWLAKFNIGADDFIQDQNKLLDGKILSNVFNILSNDKIDISKFRPVSNENDWVNILLNLRQIGSKMSQLLKENNFEMNVNFSAIAKSKDQSEFLKFMKYFILFSMKAPNRQIAIANVRALDKNYQNQIRLILEELMSKNTQGQNKSQVTKKSSIEAIQHRQKLQKLAAEIEQLKVQKSLLDKQVFEKKADIEQLESNVANKMQLTINEMKMQYNEEIKKRDAILEKIQTCEESINNTKKKITQLKSKEQQITSEIEKGNVTEYSLQQLEARLVVLKQKAMTLANYEGPELKSTLDYVKLFKVNEKRDQLDELQERISNSQSKQQYKIHELNALKTTLEAQNQKASTAMLKRIAQLNAEMDASPLGVAKRKTFQLRRVIQKIGNDIEKLEKDGSEMELKALQDELTNMAKRKAKESDLLAKKLSFMQSTADQCELRLQRLKLHVQLQLHSNRLKRFKNCFSDK